jgi:hypothetical protein
MKKIGMLGGMSWTSSVEYYRLVNEEVRDRLGGLFSAYCLLRSVDFAPIEKLQRAGRWQEAGDLLAAEAQALTAQEPSCSSSARTRCTGSPTRSPKRSTFRSCTSPTRPPPPFVPQG